MCGIAGIFSLSGRAVPDVLEAMNDVLAHRGPDDAGTFSDGPAALAMRRLSIIGVDNGHQPIFNEDRSVVTVFNGEIYNYRALKADLEAAGHVFSTASDVETVVHLYEEHGDAFVDHLRGMFALALYDRRRERLLLVRDRSGQKPLYFAVAGGLLFFASEIKAIHASGLVPKELDPDSLKSYLTYGFVVGEHTLFAGVSKLAAGHALAAGGGDTETRQYWDLPLSNGTADPPEAAAGRIRELLEASVEKRLMSEVPLGAFLSGGVDSSAVVAMMKRHLEEVQTFCVGFEESRYSELPHARAVAEHFGTRHYELVLKGVNLELLRDLNWHHDEPAGDPAAVPTFCLSRFARQRITVTLTGEGGDETFAGYPHHRHSFRFGRLESRLAGMVGPLARGVGRLAGAFGALGSAKFWKGVWIAGLPVAERHRGWYATYTDLELSRLLRPEVLRSGRNGSLAAEFRALQARVGHRDLVDQLLYVDAKLTLADQLLMKVDKTTMAASLEARCPLLDQDLLEYAATLPPSFKIGEGGSKLILRQALRGILDDDILDRPKQGFDVPLATFLERDLQDFVESGLLADSAPLGRYLDLDTVRGVWRSFRRRRDMRSAKQIWRLLNLAVWHEIHWPSGLLPDMDEPGAGWRGRNPAADLFVERGP